MLPIEGVYGFDSSYSFLSNFHPAPVELDGLLYPTVEHAYQAAKTLNADQRLQILNLPFPGQAKKAGRRVDMRPDWDNIKVSVMENLVRQKFTKYPDLALKLCQTGDIYLEETNTWYDTFWGVCNGKGQNVLGNLLMKIRNEIKPG